MSAHASTVNRVFRRETWGLLLVLVGSLAGSIAVAQSEDGTLEDRIAKALDVAQRDLSTGSPEVALELLNLFDQKYPERSDISLLRGEAFAELGRWEEARAAFRIAEVDRAYAIDAGLGSARAAAELGDVRESVHALDRAWIAGFRDLEAVLESPSIQKISSDPIFDHLIERWELELRPFGREIEVIHQIDGREGYENYGYCFAVVGDIDGDGARDFAVGAPGARPDDRWIGRVEVRSGRTKGLLHEWWSEEDRRIGSTLAAGADFDADGIPDLLVGGDGTNHPGCVSAYSLATGEELFRVALGKAHDRFGESIAVVGDLDGDAIADFLVGAPGAAGKNGEDRGGTAILYSGASQEVLARWFGQEGEGLGSIVAGWAGGGGWRIAIGNDRFGTVRLIRDDFLAAPLLIRGDPQSLPYGEKGLWFVGDLNEDGWFDFAVTDSHHNGRDRHRGRVRLFSGFDGAPLGSLHGGHGEELGRGQGRAGDVDGDGIDDLIFGASGSSRGSTDGGAIHLISGRTQKTMLTMNGKIPGSALGWDAVGIGDVNDDGNLDFLVSALFADRRGPATGRVLLVSGPHYLFGSYENDRSESERPEDGDQDPADRPDDEDER